MKSCITCTVSKPLSEFHKRKDSKDGHQGKCKSCARLASNASYVKNVIPKKTKFIEYKGSCCELCGYSKYQGALEFHHKDPTKKDFHVSDAYCKPWDEVKIELDKCSLLCSNCHKEVHGGVSHLAVY